MKPSSEAPKIGEEVEAITRAAVFFEMFAAYQKTGAAEVAGFVAALRPANAVLASVLAAMENGQPV